ncbi:type VII secretion integral membrane protein EccD [Saccharothrix mutabilis subsp. mutabilis]|uniref:Type VII secretion integral membrane protein EccD n=1 Tax=Saccharothrix mutabilis subsp. mutabilis TaxID=66855 RepID=A0ABP3CZB7_9PSEU
MQTTGLVRVTVAAPRRRIDLALPEHAAVAEVLPGLLARAGEGLADDGVAGGGWVLRRADGTAFDPDRTLAAHRVRDGEVLHLAPRRLEWPELEYDDLVDAIATGSGRDRAWGPRHTRHAGLAVGAAAVLLALVAVVRAGPSWTTPALWSLGAAVLLVGAGVVLARAVGDAAAGAVVAAVALPFAFTGGGLLLAGDRPLTDLAAGHLLLAGSALLLFALAAHLGVPAAPALFAGAVTVGALCVVAGWLGTAGWSPHECAAVVAGGVLALSPGFAPLALRLGRVPMPVLPRTTADLVRDDPQPPLPLVHLAVVRADALLTGMLAGSALVVAGCQVVLVRGDDTSALVLVGVVAVGLLLRARLYPVVRQRVPLLAAGVTGAGCLAVGPLMTDVALAGAVQALVAALVVAAGMVFSTRVPNPYVGRFAEYAEILVVVAVVPLVCSVLGLFGYVRGLGG